MPSPLLLRIFLSTLLLYCAVGKVLAQDPTCTDTSKFKGCYFYLEDGSGNQNYGNNICHNYLVVSEAGPMLFYDFYSRMEEELDSVIFYNGPSSSYPVLKYFTGNNEGESVQSTKDSVLIRFVTNNYKTGEGWAVVAECRSEAIKRCGGMDTITDCSGILEDGSKHFPLGQDLNCQWLLSPGPSDYLHIKLKEYEVDDYNAHLRVYDGNNINAPIIAEWDSYQVTAELYTSSDEVLIEFINYDVPFDPGWAIEYNCGTGEIPIQCAEETEISGCLGIIKDGSEHNLYANNTNCSWLLYAPDISDSLILYFDYFDLAEGDSILFFDGANNKAPVLAKFHQNSTLNAIESTQDSVFIVFKTDGAIQGDGWILNYRCTKTEDSFCKNPILLGGCEGSIVRGQSENDKPHGKCEWLIEVDAGKKVKLNINGLSMTHADILRIHDGTSSNADLLMEYNTWTRDEDSLVSTGSSIFISYIPAYPPYKPTIDFSYTCVDDGYPCVQNELHTTKSGEISDGSKNQFYRPNLDCSWLIQPEETNVVQFFFYEFQTELDKDSLIFYKGSNAQAPIVKSFTGNEKPEFFEIENEEVFVRFVSDNKIGMPGWKFRYNGVYRDSICTSGSAYYSNCQGEITDGSGENEYLRNCRYDITIEADSGKAIELNFTEWDISDPADYVRIYDGKDARGILIATFKGGSTPNKVVSYLGYMHVQFRSNSDISGQGFKAEYHCVDSIPPVCKDRQEFYDCDGYFWSNEFPSRDYYNSSDCEWYIQGGVGKTVKLEFTYFETEQDYDFVRVYAGSDKTGILLGEFSGEDLPDPIYADTEMFVNFVSDASGQDFGFQAKYSCNTVGINDPATSIDFSVYPNPAKNIIYLSSPKLKGAGDVRIFDISGRMMATIPLSNQNSNNLSIDCSGWQRGVYIVELAGVKKKLVLH